MLKYFLLFFIVLVFVLFNMQKVSKVHALDENATILVLGDSITYGFGVNVNESYPSILEKLTKRRVINAGINGDTSKDALKRFPNILTDNSIKMMILCIGGNDLLQKIPLHTIRENIIKIIKMAKEKNIEVVLIAVPDFGMLGLSPLALYSDIAKEEKVYLIKGLLAEILSSQRLKSDYIHPNASGYKFMAEAIYANLLSQGYLEK
ncbi:MAG: arylesterase [Sulfurimonas sp.]|nr:arylesterase [Sulfurimonas sp.]